MAMTTMLPTPETTETTSLTPQQLLSARLGYQPALGRHRAQLPRQTSSACVAPSWRSTPWPAAARAAVEAAAHQTFTRALGALTGNQAVQMVGADWRPSTCPAGRWRPTPTWPARPTRTRACTRPTRCRPSSAGSTTPCCAPTRSTTAPGRTGTADYLVPIVADAEAGFGGPLNAFELMKSMIASGAAGVHWEDQLAVGEEVRPHGRQGARSHRAARPDAQRRPARRRHHGHRRPWSSPAPTRWPPT